MKKMNKAYEAPMAEVIEMQTPVVLDASQSQASGSNVGGGNQLS